MSARAERTLVGLFLMIIILSVVMMPLVIAPARANPLYGGWTTWTVNSKSHQTRGSIKTTSGLAYGAQYVKRTDGTPAPAGHLGAVTLLYRDTAVCGIGGPHYSSSSMVQFSIAVTETLCGGAGYYRQRGTGAVYRISDGEYVPKQSAFTPLLYSN